MHEAATHLHSEPETLYLQQGTTTMKLLASRPPAVTNIRKPAPP